MYGSDEELPLVHKFNPNGGEHRCRVIPSQSNYIALIHSSPIQNPIAKLSKANISIFCEVSPAST